MANDHYVPQFYLKNFSPSGKKGRIWLYRRKLPAKLAGIKSVASDEDYYTMKADIQGVDKKQVDKFFQQMENSSRPIITKLLTASKIELSSDDREMLSMFIAFLANRTPLTQERLRKMHEAIATGFASRGADKAEFIRRAKENGFAGTDEELEQWRQSFLEADKHIHLEYQPGETDDVFMGTALELAQDSTPLIQNKQWHILELTRPGVFVTSDNPVILPRIETQSLLSAIGFGRGSVLLSLSPTRCLLMNDSTFENKVLNVKHEKVIEINERIIAGAQNAVFANVESQDIEKAFNRTIPGENTNVSIMMGLANPENEMLPS